jgi:hypothetical protein
MGGQADRPRRSANGSGVRPGNGSPACASVRECPPNGLRFWTDFAEPRKALAEVAPVSCDDKRQAADRERYARDNRPSPFWLEAVCRPSPDDRVVCPPSSFFLARPLVVNGEGRLLRGRGESDFDVRTHDPDQVFVAEAFPALLRVVNRDDDPAVSRRPGCVKDLPLWKAPPSLGWAAAIDASYCSFVPPGNRCTMPYAMRCSLSLTGLWAPS